MSSRTSTTEGALARLGFADPDRAVGLIDDRALLPIRAAVEDGQLDPLAAVMGDTADPDQCLLGLVRVAESLARLGDPPGWGISAFAAELATPGVGRERVLGVLGASTALVDELVRHPEHWVDAARAERRPGEQVRSELVRAVTEERGDRTAPDALRIAYRRGLLRIAAHDVTAADPLAEMPAVGEALAELAEAALEAALAIAREEYGDGHEACRLAIIGMGKTGGGELNYVSDVDVIFVAEPADGTAEETALPSARRWRRRRCAPARRGRRREVSGPSTRRCVPRASRGRWCAPSAATRRTTSAGPRPGSSRRSSRPGSPLGTRRSACATRPRSRRWSGRPPGATSSSRTSRPCVAASSSTCRPTRRRASSSSVPEVCGTSSSVCSCSSSCTGAATPACAPRRRSRPWPRSREVATSVGRTPPSWTAPTGTCAASSTASSCTGCAARTSCR